MKKWESEKHKNWGLPAEGFKAMLLRTDPCWEEQESGEHVAGQWCSWIMMRRWGFLHGVYGSMEAESEVQRTIKRAELTVFFMPSQEGGWTYQGAC